MRASFKFSNPSRRLLLTSLSFGLMLAIQPALAAGQPRQPEARELQDWTEDWKGIWEYQQVLKDCDTGTILFQNTSRDTICPGDVFSPGQFSGSTDFSCSVYQIDANSVHAECSGSYEVSPGCTANSDLIIDFTRNGDTMTGTNTINTTFVGDCSVSESCQLFEQTGTRIDPNPLCTATPASPSSWGTIKSRYR